MIGHWLNVELWSPMWPNMFAPSMITLAAVIVSHVRQRRSAEAARKIAADLYLHHTGERHPAAPADRESEAK